MKTTGRYEEQDPARAHIREYVGAVAAGGPGGTFALTTAGRYVVGGVVPSWVLPAHFSPAQRLASVLAFVERYNQDNYGYWKDERGRYWLDVVSFFEDRDDALIAASNRGELAIYDRDEDTEVRVP